MSRSITQWDIGDSNYGDFRTQRAVDVVSMGRTLVSEAIIGEICSNVNLFGMLALD